MLKMCSYSNPDILRGRPDEQPRFVPDRDGPFLRRRASSLSQEDENEVFEDARETWDLEPMLRAIDSPTLGVLSTIKIHHNRKDNFRAQEELRFPHHRHEEFQFPPRRHEDGIALKPAQSGQAAGRNTSIRQQAAVGNATVPGLVNGNQAPHWQTHSARPSHTRGLSLTIASASSEGYSHGPHGHSRNVSLATSIAPSVTDEDTSTRCGKECESCRMSVKNVWYCNVCKFIFCDPCWESMVLHQRPPRKGRGQMPHEKTDPAIAEKVQKVMVPPADEWLREQLYKEDEVTSWFGKTS